MSENILFNNNFCDNERSLAALVKKFSSLADNLRFFFPFAIFACPDKMVFATDNFQEFVTQSEELTRVLRQNAKNDFEIDLENFTFIKKQFAMASDNTHFFIVYMKDKTEKYNKIQRYIHDIQAPLRNIVNFLQLIEMQLDEKNRELIEHIHYAIDNVKKLSEMRIGYLVNTKKISYQSLYKVVQNISDLLKMQMVMRKCKIRIAKDIPNIKCDYYDLFSLFKNLIENSLEHAVCQYLLINIWCQNYDNNKMTICFKDNGQLSAEDRDKIKSLLSVAANLPDEGLISCKNIMQKQGGMIQFMDSGDGCAYKIEFSA